MLLEQIPVEQEQSSVTSRSCFSIGAVSLELSGGFPGGIGVNCESEEFLCHTSRADIEVKVDAVSDLLPQLRTPTFESGAVWKVFHGTSNLVFDFISLPHGAAPYKRMFVDHDFARACIEMNSRYFPSRAPVFPLEYPTDELLVTNYLACHGEGVEVHGCGIIDPETGGHLFLGHSGAGKSTTTRLWETFSKPEILSDDRIILRLHDGELWMYGTPWHGEAAFASPGKAKLNRIFILQHGKKNAVTRLSPTQAVGEVFARCFPPFHSAIGLERTLEFLSRVLDVVPCYQFEFVPNRSAVETVLNFHG